MGVLDTLSRWVIRGTAAVQRDATAALARSYSDCAQRARQLHRHSEMAPHTYSAEALAELASAEESLAQRWREGLEAVGAPLPTIGAEPPQRGALNHWGRLVQDLEAHRAAVQRLRELAVHFAEELPATSTLFDEACHEESVHCERLRTLIARADPQALD
jgi:hypothetical protein